MAFQLNQLKMQLIIILSCLASFLSGCSTPQISGSNDTPRSVETVPVSKSNTDNFKTSITDLQAGTKSRTTVINLYNDNKFLQAFQTIQAWNYASGVWKNHLVNTPGDLAIYLSLAIGFNSKETYTNLLSISNNQANSSTANIESVAKTAWDDYARWLNCIYATPIKINGTKADNINKCKNYQTTLQAKAPVAQKIINFP